MIKKISFILFASSIIITGQSQDTLSSKRHQSLKQVLFNMKMPDIYSDNSEVEKLYDYKREEYNDPEIKQRFLEVLANKWTEEELDAWAEEDIQSGFDQIERETIAKRIADKGKITYEKAFDSLTNQRKEIVKKSMSDWKVDPIIIRFAGWLDIQEAIPILKEALNDSKHYDSWPVKLALARLRVEPYYTDILKEYSFIPKKYKNDEAALDDYHRNLNVLIYLGTQESIYAISEWLYRKEMVSPIYDVENYTISISNYPVATFYYIIKNKDFKDYFSSVQTLHATEVKKEDIEFCKKWFKKNKGKIESVKIR